MKTHHGRVLVVLILLSAILSWLPLTRELENLTVDLRFRMRGPLTAPSRVVVVAIDNDTEAAWDLPKAAWPEKFSLLLDKLDTLGAKRIAFDYVIETDIDNYLSDLGVDRTPVFEFTQSVDRLGQRVILGTETGSDVIPQLRAVANLGSVSTGASSGRIVRSVPRYDTTMVPPIQGLASLAVDPGATRTDPIHINYSGRTIPTFSALDVIEGRVNPDSFRGAYVFIGSTFDSSLDTRHATPFQKQTAGVLINAEAADTLLSGRELRLWPEWGVYALAVAVAVLFGAFANRVMPAVYFAGAAAFGITWSTMTLAAFTRANQVWPVFLPLVIAFGLVPMVVYSIRTLSERARAERTRKQWSVFMPEEFILRVEANQMRGLGAWEEVQGCFLFLDIASFSEHANALGSQAVVAPVNLIMVAAIEEIQSRGGIVLNFMGDGLAALYEIKPDAEAGHVRQSALESCLKILQRVGDLNGSGSLGTRKFDVRIGMSTGSSSLALIGTEQRRQMTLYGPALNMAARCEQAGKNLNPDGDSTVSSRLVVSPEFEPELRSLDLTVRRANYRPKGWSEPLPLYYLDENSGA